jgi:Leucine-rich repeat (LRR) protein
MPPKDKKPAPPAPKQTDDAKAPPAAAAGKEKAHAAKGGGDAMITPEMKIAAALEAAEKSKVLDLCNLGLERIPEPVWNHVIEHDDMQTPLIPTLKDVRLSNNKISDFEGWEKLVNITDLSLDSNGLADTLPDAVLALTNLTRLNIQSNQLRSLPHLGDYQKLIELRANDNALQSVPPSIGTLTDLKTLEVSFNQLVMLPDEVGGCRHLVSIRARGNELKTLPVGIAKLWTLEELLLDKNPLVRLPYAVASMPLRQITYDIELLQSPPLAVAAQGPEFTMHYLKLLRAAETRGKLEIDELKLDLVPIEVCEIGSLTSLSMERNEIRSIPRTIIDLSKLESLRYAQRALHHL